MELFYYLAVTFLFMHITHGWYQVTEEKYRWNNLSNVCTVATPTLILKDKVLVANTSSNINNNVWIAYVQKQIPFEYIGCTKKINDLTEFSLKKNDPGLCFFVCNNYSIVGLYQKECYCLSNDNLKGTYRTSPYCNITCPGQTDVVCGGKNDINTNYISVYRPAAWVNKHNGTGNCLRYTSVTRRFWWHSCENTLGVVCLSGKTVIPRDSDNKSSWIESSIKCFRRELKPTTYNYTRHNISSDKTLEWTGVIRSNVIYTIDSESTIMSNKNGYLAVKDGTYNLKFADETKRKKVLCDNGTILTSPTIEPAQPSSNYSSSTAEQVKPSSNSSSPTAEQVEPSSNSSSPTAEQVVLSSNSSSPTAEHVEPSSPTIEPTKSSPNSTKYSLPTAKPVEVSSNSSSPTAEPAQPSPNSTKSLLPTAKPEGPSPTTIESADKKNLSSIIPAVGGALGVVLCIITVIVFLRKRNGQITRPKSNGNPQPVIHFHAARDESALAPSDSRHDLSDMSSEYVDIDLVTLSNNEDYHDARQISNQAEDNSELQREENKEDDDTYDTMKPRNQKSGPDEWNHYDKLTLEENSDYDHIGIGNKRSRNAGTNLPNSENIYNTKSP